MNSLVKKYIQQPFPDIINHAGRGSLVLSFGLRICSHSLVMNSEYGKSFKMTKVKFVKYSYGRSI